MTRRPLPLFVPPALAQITRDSGTPPVPVGVGARQDRGKTPVISAACNSQIARTHPAFASDDRAEVLKPDLTSELAR